MDRDICSWSVASRALKSLFDDSPFLDEGDTVLDSIDYDVSALPDYLIADCASWRLKVRTKVLVRDRTGSPRSDSLGHNCQLALNRF